MMDTFIAFLKKLTDNMGLKLLSLGLAFLLWLFVVSIENPVMNLSFTSIPLSVENADVMEKQGKAFELADSSRTVTVTVKAERSVLSELSRDNIKAVVDMNDLEGNKVPISVKSTRYSDRIKSINPTKEFANVIIEDLAKSQFRIQVETSGNLPEGYAVGTTSVQNNVVRVSGPESIVNSIAEAVVRVNITGMTNEIHTVVPILLLDEDGDEVNTETLEVSLDQVSASVEIWKVMEVPVYAGFTGTPANGYVATGVVTTEPSSVYVTGNSSALKDLTSISLPSSLLDVTGETGTASSEVNVEYYLPDNVYLDTALSSGKVKITAYVEKMSSAVLQVPYSRLAVVGLPEGMIIGNDLNTSVVSVTVRGLKEKLDAIDEGSITGILDLSGIALNENGTITPGSYAGAVVLALPGDVVQDTAVAHVLLQVSSDAVEGTPEGGADEGAAPEGEGTEGEGTEGEGHSDSDGKKSKGSGNTDANNNDPGNEREETAGTESATESAPEAGNEENNNSDQNRENEENAGNGEDGGRENEPRGDSGSSGKTENENENEKNNSEVE